MIVVLVPAACQGVCVYTRTYTFMIVSSWTSSLAWVTKMVDPFDALVVAVPEHNCLDGRALCAFSLQ
jgi:hypothetical protein